MKSRYFFPTLGLVRQWQYKPTLVERPVRVATTITVIFSLGRGRRST
jgi:hypothetical protein